MDAIGTPSHIKRAFGLGLKVVLNFEKLSPEVIEHYEQHLDQIPAALERGFVILQPQKEEKPVEPALTFSVVATTALDRIQGKSTKKCFTSKHWYYRDGDFDNRLSKGQSTAPACEVSTLALSQGWTFIEAVHALPGAPQTNDIVELGNWLIEHGHTMTLPQAEEMVEATERGGNTGLKTDGYGNFFFVETGNPNNPVSVGFVVRVVRVWLAYVYWLDYGGRWGAGDRLLLRNLNLDASKL